MTGHQSYLKRVAASALLNSVVSAVSVAVLLPWVIKRVGMQSYGTWAVLGIFVGIASILDLGTWKAVVYRLSKGEHAPRQVLASAAAIVSCGGVAFTLVVLGLLALQVPVFGEALAHPGAPTLWIGICGCVIVLSSLITGLARGVMEAHYRGHWVNAGYALLTLLQYAIAAVTTMWTSDPRALLVGTAAVHAGLCVLHLVFVQRLLPLRWEAPKKNVVTGILRYGFGVFAADLPSILFAPAILYLLLFAAANPGQYAVFDLALRIALLCAGALSMLATPFFAIVARAAAGTGKQVHRLIVRHLGITFALALAGWLTFAFVGERLLGLFFTDEVAQIHHLATIMLAGSAAAAALEPIARAQMGLARLKGLFTVRFAMLSGAMLAIAALANWPVLDRFAAACAFGYAVAVVGLLALFRSTSLEREVEARNSAATLSP